jgi:uncharacterized membrane protein YbhN (UPF0104 family)
MSGRVATGLRLAVGLGALAFLLVRVDLETAGRTIARADPAWLGIALLAQLAAKFCWIRRWGVLLEQAGHPRRALELLRLVLLGLFFNNFLPTSVGGDVARGLALAGRGVPKALAAATVVADRLIGLFSLGIMAILGGVLGLAFWPGEGPWLVAGLFALGLVAAIPVLTRPRVLDGLARSRLLSPAGHLTRRVRRLLDRVSFLSGHGPAVARAVALSLGLSACSAVYHWSVGRALGVQVPLAAWFVIVPTVMLFAALPITLNGLGVRELGFVGLLGAQGVPAPAATVFALLAFVGTLGFAVAGGILFLTGGRNAGRLEGEAT